MSDKRKFPRAEAVAVAKEFCDALKRGCERLIVAGSLRRRRLEVGDVEILYIPKMRTVELPAENLFDPPGTAQIDEVDAYLDWLLEQGVIRQRLNVNGGTAWGEKNKLAVHVGSGIPVDFFATTEGCWFNYLVCRTGGQETNVRIASAAKAKGWRWNPYEAGFSHLGSGEHFDVKSERDVFEFVGLPYREPWERR